MCDLVQVLRMTLVPDARSVAEARRAVFAGLCPRQDERTRETAVLLTSELVTNAITYGTPPIELEVDCSDDHELLVRVSDTAPGLPHRERPSADDVHGRGLGITAALSDEWGVEPTPAGKIVWFRLRAHG